MPEPLRIRFLGGLGEIGRNCMAFELDEQILLLDCGLMFPDADMHGIDLVLPDFTWLREQGDRVVGCIATHGHEDHVGGLSYLLRDLSFPIFGSALTLRLAQSRIQEAGLAHRTQLVSVRDGDRCQIGPFDVEFIPVAHSVPHGFATAWHTPHGVVLHSGDFKLDLTPVDGRRTDLARIGALADGPGIRLLLADSTNAEEHGHSPSETSVGGVLRTLFAEERGRRIITTSFASHLHRIQQIADAAIACGRKVATLGMSMRRNVALARELGILHIPDGSLIDIEELDRYEPGEVCVVSTGSQGEPMSALSLLAQGRHRYLKASADDTVIMSSHAIPGNEGNVNRVIDGLLRVGARVIHSGLADVHATGHAQAEELKTLLAIARPDWFVPVHGEYRHLSAHAGLARTMGVPDDHVLLCEDGDVVTIDEAGVGITDTVPAGYQYVDGIVGDIGPGVLRDRATLAADGMVVVIVTVDATSGRVLAGPEIISKGWAHASSDVVRDAPERITEAIERAFAQGATDPSSLERVLREVTARYVRTATERRPIIVPVVMEV